jgi:hypothetical protein
MASEPQVNYMLNLAGKKDLTKVSPVTIARLNSLQALESLNNTEVNVILDELKAQPWLPKKPAQGSTSTASPTQTAPATQPVQEDEHVPLNMSGRYFITDPTDGVEKFVIVSVSVQASDFLYPVKEPVHRNTILQTIAKNPVTSMNEYGMKLGICGVCGRTLTRRDSRLRGMGPICAARFGSVATPEQVDMLRELGLIKPESHDSPFSELGPHGEDLSSDEYDASDLETE